MSLGVGWNSHQGVIGEIAKPLAAPSYSLVLRLKELEGQQESLLKSVICAFNQLLDLRDLGTGIHSTRLAEWAVRIARKMGLPEADL